MPITNIPSADSLNDFALALYFDAWSRLADIQEAFDMTYEGDRTQWTTEWEAYMLASQKDFETIMNLLAQAAEIAMKARLCTVSPYLLLLGNGSSYKTSAVSIDFTELRTVDAVDLPGMVNTFCPAPLSEAFLTAFEKLRKRRNKSMHLGSGAPSTSVEDALERLTEFFGDLWPDRAFLPEWVRASSKGRHSFFHDGKNGSPHADVLWHLKAISGELTKRQFKRVFGREKAKRKYYCFECLEHARLDWTDWDSEEAAKTAYLNDAGDALDCVMCEQSFEVERAGCAQDGCPGNVLAPEKLRSDASCHTCCQ